MELPSRKLVRLKQHRYSEPNAYFVTLCSAGRRPLFWSDVGASIARPPGASPAAPPSVQ